MNVKHRLMAWCEQTIRAKVAEEIARKIEMTVCGPGSDCEGRFCPDCIRYRQARRDAALARRVGGAQ